MVESLTQRGLTSPTLAELLVEAIEAARAEHHQGLPAKVVKFDGDKQSCDVQPLLLRVILDEDQKEVKERYPQITNVPINYPNGGGWSLIFPLKPDDTVYLAFSERSLDRWLESDPGQEIDPEHARKHDLSDAVCVPGIRVRKNAIKALASIGDNCRIGRDDGTDPAIVLKVDGTIEIGEDATEALVLGDNLNTALSALTVPTAFGPSGPPINAGTFGQHLSPKGKVK